MTSRPDLAPPAQLMADLVGAVRDDQLTQPTPCENYSLGDLLDHVNGLALGLAWAAAKHAPEGPSAAPSGDASRLGDDWRTVIPERLTSLVDAWRDPDAWTGSTQAGGIDLPGEVAGLVTLNELLVHGWDVARASGQQYAPDPEAVEVSLRFLTPQADADDGGSEGIFGPIVKVPADAPALDRVIGLSGRDPRWTPR